jgi:hypothetical protein
VRDQPGPEHPQALLAHVLGHDHEVRVADVDRHHVERLAPRSREAAVGIERGRVEMDRIGTDARAPHLAGNVVRARAGVVHGERHELAGHVDHVVRGT